MIALLKLFVFPLVSLLILILGNGYFITFVSLRLDLAQVSSEMIGLVTASFYAGVFLACFLVMPWIRRLGHLRTWILLCGINGILIAAHFLWVAPSFWLFLRFFCGIVMGGFYIVIESWLLLLSPAPKRSLSLAIYGSIYFIATSAGQLLLDVCDPYSWTPYFVASSLSFLAIVPCIGHFVPVPAYHQPQPFALRKMIRLSFKGFFVGCISGLLMACIYGLVPVYGREMGQSIAQIGAMMAVIVLGGLALVLPLGKWADSWNRRKVMVFTCFTAALFSALIGISGNIFWGMQLVLFWMFGGFSISLYPLALALACEKIADDQIVAVTSGLNIVYGVGAIAGPVLAPLFMIWFGTGGLFYFIGAACLIAGLVGLDLVVFKDY